MSSRVRSIPRCGLIVTTHPPARRTPSSDPTCAGRLRRMMPDLGTGRGHERRRRRRPSTAARPTSTTAVELERRRGRVDGQDLGDPGRQRVVGPVGRPGHVGSSRALADPRVGGRRGVVRHLGHARRVGQAGVDEALLHRHPVGPVERLPDGPDGALGRDRRLGRDAGRDLVGPVPQRGPAPRPRSPARCAARCRPRPARRCPSAPSGACRPDRCAA